MSKIRVKILIEVNKKSKAAKEWADIDDFVDDEIKEVLFNIRDVYANWNPESVGKSSAGTKWIYETKEI